MTEVEVDPKTKTVSFVDNHVVIVKEPRKFEFTELQKPYSWDVV